MKWIGQHIWDYISRFRNDIYLESISSGTIASGGHLGLDSDNKIVKASVSSGGISHDGSTADGVLTYKDADEATVEQYLTFANGSNISTLSLLSNQDTGDKFTITTTTHGATTLTTTDDDATAAHFEIAADGNITLDAAGDIALEAAGDDITMEAAHITLESTAANDPTVTIQNTADDTNSPRLRFFKRREDGGTLQVGEDGDGAGEILFNSYDDNSPTPSGTNYAKIEGFIHDATNGQESGQLKLQVAAHDGGVEDGIVLTGGSVDAEVDVTIGNGTASVTTIAGTLTMGSTATINNSGVIQVAAQTVIDHDQLANYAANEHFTQANITTVGTIGTGVWQGTAIATDYLKHKSTFELAGYSVADGSNYFYSNIMSGNKAPFLHDVNIGSDGLTADNPAAFLRANGTVMPYNGTLKIWKGWGASNGTPTVNIAIFKYTPTADDASNDSLVLVKNTQITGAGNDNLKAFSETSFSVTVAAGDILITAMKGSVNAKTAYFVSTVEIEWTS
jgi:hypothetical protein